MMDALTTMLGGHSTGCIFSDSITPIQMIRLMYPDREHSSVHEIFASVLNGVKEVVFGWSSGHAGIAGNEIADIAAVMASKDGLVADGLPDFEQRAAAIGRQWYIDKWKQWHVQEEHYYYTQPSR